MSKSPKKNEEFPNIDFVLSHISFTEKYELLDWFDRTAANLKKNQGNEDYYWGRLDVVDYWKWRNLTKWDWKNPKPPKLLN